VEAQFSNRARDDVDDLDCVGGCEPGILEQDLGRLVELNVVLTQGLKKSRPGDATDAH
jgi:hypothetical protein